VVTLVLLSVGSFPGIAAATPGAKLWGHRYNGPRSKADDATALEVSPDGSTVFVTGSSLGLTSAADYTTIAYDAPTGHRLWTMRYDGTGGGGDQAVALGVSPNGSTVFVTGSSRGLAGDRDFATVAYDAPTGTQLWIKRYAGPGNGTDRPNALAVSPDGSQVFVTGRSIGSSTSSNSWDYATVAYDASAGTKLWTQRYDDPASSDDLANALGVSPDGSTVFVTGQSAGSPAIYEIATIAYDATTGDPLWTKRFDDPETADDVANALGVSPDGSTVFVTGYGRSASTDFDYQTVAIDTTTGDPVWSKRYNGPADYEDVANALGMSPDGSQIFVTGVSWATLIQGANYATVAYDAATGAEQWVGRYTRTTYDAAKALAVSPDGSAVFVTGMSNGDTGRLDFATVAYDTSTGTELWVRRYNGPANNTDQANAIGVNPDGSAVYVTGSTYGFTSDFDYATLAYSTV
jgi:sugar lactone lactonase YvrE